MGCNNDYCELEQWPVRRDLDGVYFRVQRDGKWESLCFTDLTAAEQDDVSKDMPVEWWRRLAWHLAGTLRRVGDDLDLVGGIDDGSKLQ